MPLLIDDLYPEYDMPIEEENSLAVIPSFFNIFLNSSISNYLDMLQYTTLIIN